MDDEPPEVSLDDALAAAIADQVRALMRGKPISKTKTERLNQLLSLKALTGDNLPERARAAAFFRKQGDRDHEIRMSVRKRVDEELRLSAFGRGKDKRKAAKKPSERADGEPFTPSWTPPGT